MKKEHQAIANGRNMPISFKYAIEIAKWIRGKKVAKAKTMLEAVISQKRAVPMTRFNKDVGHKAGKIAAGRFPIKASTEILMLLKSAETNAQDKGLNTESLVIAEIVTNKGTTSWRFGRQKRRQSKRTHVTIVLEEAEKKVKETTPKATNVKKVEVKEEKKTETKPKVVKKETKEENKK